MTTYYIRQIVRSKLLHSITAETLEEAIQIWREGEANLIEDETTDIYDEQWYDSDDKNITIEAENIMESVQ